MDSHKRAVEQISDYFVEAFRDLDAVQYARRGTHSIQLSEYDSDGQIPDSKFPVEIRVVVRLRESTPRNMHTYNQTVLELGLVETPTPIRAHGDSETTLVFSLSQSFTREKLEEFSKNLSSRSG